MKIESMREFIVFAQHLNFTAAAKKLYTTQPALSYRIAAMERELGFALVDRGDPLGLTAAGSIFFAEAQKVVEDYDALVTRCEQVARHRSEALRIEKPVGMLAISRPFYELTSAFVRDHSAATVSLTATNRTPLLDVLLSGRADAGVVFDMECFAGEQGAPDLEFVALPAPADCGLYVAFSNDDPLAKNDRLVMADLEGRALAWQADPRYEVGRRSFQRIFARAGVQVTFHGKPRQDGVDFLWDMAPGELLVSDSSLVGMCGPGTSLPGYRVLPIEEKGAEARPYLVFCRDALTPTLEEFAAFVTGRMDDDVL